MELRWGVEPTPFQNVELDFPQFEKKFRKIQVLITVLTNWSYGWPSNKNRVFLPPKWMVKIMETPIKMDDLGVNTPIFGNTYMLPKWISRHSLILLVALFLKIAAGLLGLQVIVVSFLPWSITICKICTPPKFNIAPEKWWLEDYFPIGKVTFQGLC